MCTDIYFHRKRKVLRFKMKNEILMHILLILCLIEICLSLPTDYNTNEYVQTSFGVTPESIENLYRRAAIANGMDPVLVSEVVRTKKPIVKTETDGNGFTYTTTYKFNPDGSISRHTLSEYAPSRRESQNTIAPKTTSVKEIVTDWEWNPTSAFGNSVPSRHSSEIPNPTPIRPSSVSNHEFPMEQLPGFPVGNTRPIKLPDSWDPSYWQNQETSFNSHPFQQPNFLTPTIVTKSFNDENGTRITTNHTSRKNLNYPRESTLSTPFPSLEDFLKSQYATSTAQPSLTSTESTLLSTIPTNSSKPITTINIDDLPITHVVSNGNPEDILNMLAKGNPERSNNGFTVYKVPETISPGGSTYTKTVTKTTHSTNIPIAASFDPEMRGILNRAGINPEESQVEPDRKVITTTYTMHSEPTEFRGFFNKPSLTHPPKVDQPQGPFRISDVPMTTTPRTYITSHFPLRPTYNKSPTEDGTEWPSTAFKDLEPNLHPNPIDNFLAKLDMTAADITASNGEVIKTIIDGNGRVLSATFVLSTVREKEKDEDKAKNEPIK